MARARFLRGSARKMRRVAALVRGMNVDHATALLKQLPKRAARPLAKAIHAARANALQIEGTAHHRAEDFVVADIRIDGGPIMRRIRAVGMGRAYRIRKRLCHLRVVVSDEVATTAGGRRAIRSAQKAAPETVVADKVQE
ncbi:MAG TPA: 50S ribosomal protein L22 [candidate division Zixibacteria bacterium]